MKLKLFISLTLAVFTMTFVSACSEDAGKTSEEVVINTKSGGSSDEVYITKSDGKVKTQPISTTQSGTQFPKKTLSDNSQVETVIDGFGNQIETRYFSNHPRLRMVIVRTSSKGQQEVTVYGNGGKTKIVRDLPVNALTASGDEIANAAQLTSTATFGGAKNFMKKGRTESPTSLQPLPSSAFSNLVPPVNQSSESVPPAPSDKSETPAAPQTKLEED